MEMQIDFLQEHQTPMFLADTHTHLDFPHFDGDRERVIERAVAAGVRAMVNVGADLASSRTAVALAEAYPQVYAAVGVHPHDAKTLTEEMLEELGALASHPRVVAIGEVGLDFYRDLSPRDKQRQAFKQQSALASEKGVSLEEVARITSNNAQALFALKF